MTHNAPLLDLTIPPQSLQPPGREVGHEIER